MMPKKLLVLSFGKWFVETLMARVAYPFERLANDKGNIWWIEPHQTNASGDLSSTEARDQHLNAGFSDDVLAAFRQFDRSP